MPAIYVAQALHLTVILSKEEGGVGAVGGILAEKLVHGFQDAQRLIRRDRALAAQVRLQIRHQKSSGDAFARNVANH
jgi:hypothetical protein